MNFFQVDGVNSAPEVVSEYDTHCPMMGQRRLNYFEASCRLRQGNPQHRYCHPVCRFEKKKQAMLKK